MAKPIETLSIQLEFKDGLGTQQIIDKIRNSFKGLEQVLSGNTKPAIQKLRNEINTFAATGNKSITTIESQVTALRALRREADINSNEFKQLTADISKFEKQLGKAQGRRPGRGGGALAATQTAGAVVSGGIFGGVEGAVGALGGAALGGVPGAFAGAAIGAQVGNIRKQAGAVAETVATFNKYQIALAGVSRDQADFNTSIQAAKQFSEQFVVPLDTTIAQYTKLKASVVGAGLGTDETNKAFEALSASVIATGGSTEDLNSALRAASQVFSKGKVSAEELRQQIGERLPGSFTIFADSMGISSKQLDKLLEQGKVTLDDFVGFTEELIRRYGTTAEELAKAPELAGARLEVAIKKAQLAFGGFFANVGADFEDYFTNLIDFALENEETLKDVIAQFVLFGENVATVFTEIGKGIVEIFGPIFEYLAGEIAKFSKSISGDIVRSQRLEQYASIYGRTSQKALTDTGAQRAFERFPGVLQTEPRQAARLEEIDKLLVSGLGLQAGGIDRLAQIRSSLDLKIPTNFGSGLRDRVRGNQPDGTQGGVSANEIKDIAKAEADAQIKSIQNRTRGIELTKEAIAKEAELARVAAEKLPPNKKSVELARIAQKEANQLNKLEQDQIRNANNVAKAKLDLNQLLAKAKGEQGLLNDKQLQQELNQIKVNELMLKYNILVEENVISTEDLRQKLEEAVAAINTAKSPLQSFKDGLKEVFKSAMDLNQALADAGVQAVQTLGDTFADFVATGKANFKEMTASILQDLARIFARAALFKTLSLIPGIGGFLGLASKGAVIGGKGGPPTTMPDKVGLMAANGMAFAKNKIVPYAKGGIVSKPTLFQYASGGAGRFGLMGEAGPEAIMPLRRGPDGRLGVQASGGVGDIIVNVDAQGSSVQGDQPNAKALGSVIGAAVQTELIKQKRPGGLLS